MRALIVLVLLGAGCFPPPPPKNAQAAQPTADEEIAQRNREEIERAKDEVAAADANLQAAQTEAKRAEDDSCKRMEIEIGLSIRDIVRRCGEPMCRKANYGQGERLQCCWSEPRSLCVYDVDSDGRIDGYN